MLDQYFKDIYKTYKVGDATEASYYPDLKNLLNNFLKSKGIDPNITIQPRVTKAGIPDFTVRKDKELIGYVEAKDLTIGDLQAIEHTDQIKRYKEKLPNFILTNYFDFWLWRCDIVNEKKGSWVKKVRIGQPITLRLNTPPPPQKEKEFFELLEAFFSYYLPERKTAKSLAIELASRTQLLFPYIVEELKNNTETEIDRIYSAFKKFLISDLTKEGFADIYAQTITYGLFTARLRYQGRDFNRFLAQELIPKNVQILYDTFNLISHEKLIESLAWIVDDMATILAHADIEKIKEELHHKKGGDDPLMHFYETFLAEYDPKKRKARGVYYTPSQVVSYITRSINILLKEKFDKKMGFASEGVTLLDPASGTLTFPANSIMLAKEEIDKSQIAGSWLQIVKNHILKNYYSFELLMAPYIIGHLKISLLLEDLGYKLQNSERFQLYLTNTLDFSKHSAQKELPGIVYSLTEEAERAKEVKEKIPVLVVMGNPPYSVSSSNVIKEGSDFHKFYESYKEKVRTEERTIQPLSDDYIKFIAFAHWKIKQIGQGIIGMITNNSYLDGLIHRDMRRKLMEDFDEIYILNLHGSSKRNEKTLEGGKDENVFDIQQGVGIIILVKKEGLKKKVNHFDLYGLREEKYKFLEGYNVKNTKWQELELKAPNYFFIQKDTKGEKLYDTFISLKNIFNKHNAGIATGKDDVLVDFNKDSLIRKLSVIDKDLFKTLMGSYKVSEDLIEKWHRELKGKNIGEQIKDYNYRIFDKRFVIYNSRILQRSRDILMKHLLKENISLVTTKILSSEKYEHIFISNCAGDRCFISNRGREANYFFPLYLYDENKLETIIDGQEKLDLEGIQHTLRTKKDKTSNIKREIVKQIVNVLNKKISPEDIFNYIYAVLYSNIYREKYNEFLKIDFPKIPFTENTELFYKVAELGKELVDLHLLKPEKLEKPISKFLVIGDNVVKKREFFVIQKPEIKELKGGIDSYKTEYTGSIWINDKQYFNNVEQEVWNYHIGGYQVLNKWLKDRIGKTLSPEDINHYLKIITALKYTIETQKEIDKLYPEIEKDLIL
jgi:predicted helicase